MYDYGLLDIIYFDFGSANITQHSADDSVCLVIALLAG